MITATSGAATCPRCLRSPNRANSSCHIRLRCRSEALPSSSFQWTHSKRSDQPGVQEPRDSMIRVEGLRKSFGDVRAVDGVELHIERGDVLVLLGQNGAGKSTTLRWLGGIMRPDAGLIELDGLRLPERLDSVRARLGVVPDQARLYGRNTAPEYLDHFGFLYGIPEAIRRRRIADLLERFELADRKNTVLAAYSRGMAQKVALIRATLHEPDWIFCDEPTAGLDPVAAADMRRYLDEQRSRGAALIVTTHVLSEAELMADRIAIMRRGVVVTTGALDDLRRQAGQGRRFIAHLARPDPDAQPVSDWLREHALEHSLGDDWLRYTLPWQANAGDRADFAARLQALLAQQGAPFHELEEEETTLESVYLKAMAMPAGEPHDHPEPSAPVTSGIRAPRMFASIRNQGGMLRHSLPFYVSSWWRRGDLSWVGYLNAFVLLLVVAFVAAVTSYWAAMGRMLGFMLFPREGAAGGAWSFLLSPVSAAVADLPLALFVFRSPLAPASLLLPITACVALTILCGGTFDRERLMETGLSRIRRRRSWLPVGVLRRNAAAIAAGVLLAAAPAGFAAAISANAHWHSWSDVRAAAAGQPIGSPQTTLVSSEAPAQANGVTVAAAGLSGIVATLALMLFLVALSFAAFFLLGFPALAALVVAAAVWGVQLGFGSAGPLRVWLAGAGGIALLALALNTGAALPIYWSLAFGSGRRLDRLREAWSNYWALFRGLVIPACALFGVVVFRLLAGG